MSTTDLVFFGITMFLGLVILILSFYMLGYVTKRTDDGYQFPMVSKNTQDKILNGWRWFNRGFFIILALYFVITSYLVTNKKSPEPEVVIPPKTVEVIRTIKEPAPKPVLDQETYFYCLDKATTRKEGISADTVNACKDAALNSISKPIVLK